MTFSYSRNRHRHESMERLASRYQSALEALIEHCLSPDAGGYLPCDFPLAAITRAELRALAPAPVRVEDLLRLSPMQMGILYHTVGDGDAQTYFSQITLRGTGPLDSDLLKRAWQLAVDRHCILRTSFHWEALEQPAQMVHPHASIELAEHDWRGLRRRGTANRIPAVPHGRPRARVCTRPRATDAPGASASFKFRLDPGMEFPPPASGRLVRAADSGGSLPFLRSCRGRHPVANGAAAALSGLHRVAGRAGWGRGGSLLARHAARLPGIHAAASHRSGRARRSGTLRKFRCASTPL